MMLKLLTHWWDGTPAVQWVWDWGLTEHRRTLAALVEAQRIRRAM